MTRGSRIAIGTASLILGSFFGLISLDTLSWPDKPVPLYLLTACCFLLALVCIAPTLSPALNRVLGGAIFAVCLYEFLRRSDSTIHTWEVLDILWILGIPGAYFMIFGKLPRWAKMTSVVLGENPRPRADDPEQL
jgi:hypothetical protein